ncbi:hypothetical protein [Streptomyces sp. NPDC001020]
MRRWRHVERLFLQGLRPVRQAHATDREILGHTVPASWFQAAVPLFVPVLAPLVARWWTRAGGRMPTAALRQEPTTQRRGLGVRAENRQVSGGGGEREGG